ncbi:MAG: hypothetical protein ACYDEJ_16710 [Desulfitobacteriaceae bacterium]
MEIKNTPALLVSGALLIVIFGLWLRKRYYSFDFTQRYGKLFFILENYELTGAVLIGVILILIAIFG